MNEMNSSVQRVSTLKLCTSENGDRVKFGLMTVMAVSHTYIGPTHNHWRQYKHIFGGKRWTGRRPRARRRSAQGGGSGKGAPSPVWGPGAQPPRIIEISRANLQAYIFWRHFFQANSGGIKVWRGGNILLLQYFYWGSIVPLASGIDATAHNARHRI